MMRDIYISSNLNPLSKLISGSASTELRYPSMEHLLNDHKEHPNQHNNQKICDEMGHPIFDGKSMKTEMVT